MLALERTARQSLANVFHPDYLQRLARHDEPAFASAARYGGVPPVRRFEDGYGIFPYLGHQQPGDEPDALFDDRGFAFVAAAVLPSAATEPSLWTRRREDGVGMIFCQASRPVGWSRYCGR